MRKVYLDNAATSFPKPDCVIEAMVDFMKNTGCNPGRGGYEKSIEAGRIVYETRCLINEFFNGPGADNCIFTPNITTSLNTVIKGAVSEGWHVITTSIEHNSIMRPLRRLEAEKGIKITVLQCSKDGSLDTDKIKEAVTKDTKALIMTHASNLMGTILPVEEAGNICSRYGIYFIVDTAQTAGTINIDMKKYNIDALCFTGHKGLMGPQGIGGFLISESLNRITSPLIEGGTGSKSHLEYQPDILPDKFESGTLNTPGIAGLKAGIEFINHIGIDNIRNHEKKLLDLFLNGLKEIEGVTIYGPQDGSRQTSTVSMNIKDMDPAEVSFLLDSKYGIMTRTGMHCTPGAHKTICTYPQGTVRFSIGYFNTEEEIAYTVKAIAELSKGQI